MEYWVFQPQANITILEIANLLSKLRKIPVLDKNNRPTKEWTEEVGVYDHTYDEMTREYRRHFRLHKHDNVYHAYTT